MAVRPRSELSAAADKRPSQRVRATKFQVVNRVSPRLPPLAMSEQEAASALGVSVDFFYDHIAHELRVVQIGRRRLIPIIELERWLDAHADLAVAT